MKTKNYKRPIALFLAVVLCAAMLFSLGTTAFAAGETEDVCLIAFPRDGDENYSGEWGHGNLNFMNGWSTKASAFTLIRAMGQYSGNICYCIEPGVSQQPGDSLTKKGEDFWDNYPAAYNKTISPEDIKLLIGRIFQYGYTGPISVSWRSQNDGGDKLAHAVATQLLIWETVVGERDADFNKIGTNGKDAIVDQISTNHPLYGQIMGYYSSIAANVQYHSSIPSFLSKTAAGAQTVSLEWTGETYAVTLTDKNGVLSAYSFSSSNPDIKFSVKGNKLTISTAKTLNEPVAITAEKSNSRRSGVITWTDGVYGPNGKLQDTVTYAQAVADPSGAAEGLFVPQRLIAGKQPLHRLVPRKRKALFKPQRHRLRLPSQTCQQLYRFLPRGLLTVQAHAQGLKIGYQIMRVLKGGLQDVKLPLHALHEHMKGRQIDLIEVGVHRVRLAELLAHGLRILPRGIDRGQRAVAAVVPDIARRSAFDKLLRQLLRGILALKRAQLQGIPRGGRQGDFPLLHGFVKVGVGGNGRGSGRRLDAQIPAARHQPGKDNRHR